MFDDRDWWNSIQPIDYENERREMNISLEGLDKADVLVALYNASSPIGMGFLQYDPAPMTHDEAAQLLEQQTYFDYLKGRLMRVDLSGSELDTWGYDRDNGEGAAQRAIEAMRSGDSAAIEAAHSEGKLRAAEGAREMMQQETTISREGGILTILLGGSDIAEHLGPAIDKALE